MKLRHALQGYQCRPLALGTASPGNARAFGDSVVPRYSRRRGLAPRSACDEPGRRSCCRPCATGILTQAGATPQSTSRSPGARIEPVSKSRGLLVGYHRATRDGTMRPDPDPGPAAGAQAPAFPLVWLAPAPHSATRRAETTLGALTSHHRRPSPI